MEHLHHFDLDLDPFQNEPDLRFYVDSVFHRGCQLRVERGLRQRKGLCVLTGKGGTGKTLLARRILDSLEEEMFDANLMVMLAGAADAESVLMRFARQLGIDHPARDRSALLAQVYEQLAIVREDGRHCVLILDDAQLLTPDGMAEVCGLANLEYEERRLLSLLLVGHPELAVALSQDPSLAARVDVRVKLSPLDLPSSNDYLLHRLGVVGGRAGLFSESAIGALYKFSEGRPRLLNSLADNALFEAYLEGKTQVESDHVERCAADLGIAFDDDANQGWMKGGGSAREIGELDLEMVAAGGDALPAFEASNSGAPASADVTHIDLAREMSQVGDESEIDELFVELIEE